MTIFFTPFACSFTLVHDVYVSFLYRLQAPPSGGPLRVNTNGPSTSPNQQPESTTHFGLKIEPYTLDPGSPPFIDPITGEVAQRPHTTHVSPPAVVTSSMIPVGPGSGSGRYRKSYKLTTKSSSNGNGSLNGGYGASQADTNSFLTAFGSPTTTSPFDPTNAGLSDQVSYGSYLESYAAHHHLEDHDDPKNGITSFSKLKWRTNSDNFPSTVCYFTFTKNQKRRLKRHTNFPFNEFNFLALHGAISNFVRKKRAVNAFFS